MSLDFIPAVYQLIGLGFAIFAVGLFFTIFARGVFRVIRSYHNA